MHPSISKGMIPLNLSLRPIYRIGILLGQTLHPGSGISNIREACSNEACSNYLPAQNYITFASTQHSGAVAGGPAHCDMVPTLNNPAATMQTLQHHPENTMNDVTSQCRTLAFLSIITEPLQLLSTTPRRVSPCWRARSCSSPNGTVSP